MWHDRAESPWVEAILPREALEEDSVWAPVACAGKHMLRHPFSLPLVSKLCQDGFLLHEWVQTWLQLYL